MESETWNLFYWLKVLVDYGGMRLSPTYIVKLNYVYMQDNFVDMQTLALVWNITEQFQ